MKRKAFSVLIILAANALLGISWSSISSASGDCDEIYLLGPRKPHHPPSWDLIPDKPWVWTGPKRHPEHIGQYELRFERNSSFANLPPLLKEISSRPWRQIFRGTLNPNESVRPILKERPILEFHVVDIDSLPTYHQTSFRGAAALVRFDNLDSLASGFLDADNINMTNSQHRPAFYTQLDIAASLMTGLPEDLVLKINIQNKKNVSVLALIEPTEPEMADLLHRLTGDENYWNNFKKNKKEQTAYDFDLFQNAVLQALRENFGYEPDMMLYLNSFREAPMGVGGLQTWTYAWPIFYDKELLTDVRVDKVYYYPYSSSKFSSEATGTNDWLYVPVSKAFVDALDENPRINETLRRWQYSGPFWKLKELLGRDDNTFWGGDYMDQTQRYLAKMGWRHLQKELKIEPEADNDTIDLWILSLLSRELFFDDIF